MNQDKTVLEYVCPSCKNRQFVYLNLDIKDGERYRFTTECDDCGKDLEVEVKFNLKVGEKEGTES